MGAILAVCGSTFCAMVSDGRMVEEPADLAAPHILTEKLPKVRKINNKVLVGFAGDPVAAAQIINALDEYQLPYLTLEKTVRILREKAQTVQCLPLGVQLLVGGRSRKGGFVLTGLSSANAWQEDTQPARENAYLIEGACAHTQISPFLEEYVKPQAAAWRTMDEVAASLDGCIKALAAQDKTVNTEFFRQLVM